MVIINGKDKTYTAEEIATDGFKIRQADLNIAKTAWIRGPNPNNREWSGTKVINQINIPNYIERKKDFNKEKCQIYVPLRT